uniref:Uncharacterized protein n=1 Tax=Neobodo designis TaxID=312471 RepID=A0A7S1L870_NEODS
MPRKADLLTVYATHRAVVTSRQRGDCWTPPPGCREIRWNQPMPLPNSAGLGISTGSERRKWDRENGWWSKASAEDIAALAAAWRDSCESGRAPLPSRIDYQQLPNKKPKNKWRQSGRVTRGTIDDSI